MRKHIIKSIIHIIVTSELATVARNRHAVCANALLNQPFTSIVASDFAAITRIRHAVCANTGGCLGVEADAEADAESEAKAEVEAGAEVAAWAGGAHLQQPLGTAGKGAVLSRTLNCSACLLLRDCGRGRAVEARAAAEAKAEAEAEAKAEVKATADALSTLVLALRDQAGVSGSRG